MQKEKYIVSKIRLFFEDGTKSNIRTCKEVFNLQSYREYLMVKHNAVKVEFTYETIPLESERKLKLKLSLIING